MNTDIELQKKLKKRLGVTITKNMGLKDLIHALSRIPPEISVLIPELSSLISAANLAIEVQEASRQATQTSTSAYTDSQELLEETTSTVYTGGATTSLKVSAESSKALEMVQNQAIHTTKDQTLSYINSLV